MSGGFDIRTYLHVGDVVQMQDFTVVFSSRLRMLFGLRPAKRMASFLYLGHEPADESEPITFGRVLDRLGWAQVKKGGAEVWLKEVDAGTPNACWVVCHQSDDGATLFKET